MARITLKDIARETGFSVVTVSQVLNGNKENHASPENREIIRKVAKRLNYQPNLIARRLVTKRSDIIGVLIDSMSPKFIFDTLFHLEKLIRNSAYRMQISIYHDDFQAISQYVGDFRGNNIDNIICLSHAYPSFGHLIPELLQDFEHVVFLGEPMGPTKFPFVEPNHYCNFHDITAKLLQNGQRRIFCIRLNYPDHAFYNARKGMADAYEEAGIPFDENFWHVINAYSIDDFLEKNPGFVDDILRLKPEVLILPNDQLLLKFQKILEKKGLHISKDIALISSCLTGFGDYTSPTISGIDYNAAELAAQLLKLLHGKSPEPAVSVPSKLVWKESCPLVLD